MEAFLEFLKVVVICAAALIALTGILAVIVSNLSPDNPLRIVLFALVKRVGLTGALMFVDVPALGFPVAGELFDIGTVIFLACYWFSFFSEARVALAPPAGDSWR